MKLRGISGKITPQPWQISTAVSWNLAAAAMILAAAAVSFQLVKILDLTVLMLNAVIQCIIFTGAAAAAAILYFAPPENGKLQEKLGLKLLSSGDMKLLFTGAAAIFAGNIVITVCWDMLLEYAAIELQKTQPLLMMIPEAENMEFAALLLTIGILTPAAEELFFRRLIYGALLRIGGFAAALITTAAIFAAAHGFIYGIPCLFWLGIVFQLSYLKSGNILLPILLHSAVNITALAAARCGILN